MTHGEKYSSKEWVLPLLFVSQSESVAETFPSTRPNFSLPVVLQLHETGKKTIS